MRKWGKTKKYVIAKMEINYKSQDDAVALLLQSVLLFGMWSYALNGAKLWCIASVEWMLTAYEDGLIHNGEYVANTIKNDMVSLPEDYKRKTFDRMHRLKLL